MTTKLNKKAKGKIHASPWYKASKRVIYRKSGDPRQGICALDHGVNFFVEALEKLGATTLHSCEGHPEGFYIMFKAPYPLAKSIAHAGFFDVSIVSNVCHPKKGVWRLSAFPGYIKEEIKSLHLAWTSEVWVKELLGTHHQKH